jgi:hypothetical protein
MKTMPHIRCGKNEANLQRAVLLIAEGKQVAFYEGHDDLRPKLIARCASRGIPIREGQIVMIPDYAQPPERRPKL